MPTIPVSITDQEAFRATMARAAQEIVEGRLVAFPTETVYGLGADATNGEALARIFERKGRPRINPLIVHAPDVAAASQFAAFSDVARRLADAFWPGPLTLALPRLDGSAVHDLASAGLPTLALRVPAHPVAQALLRAAGRPIAAPSANASGEPSPTRASHVVDSLGTDDLTILDGGPAQNGIESTVIGFDGDTPILLRLGAVPREEIERITGTLGAASDAADAPASPGRLLRHYAPRARLRLNAAAPEADELFMAFGTMPPGADGLQLSAGSSLREAAANLFALLREADKRGVAMVAIAPIPNDGLGEAINDRLMRAAAAQTS